MSRIPIHLEPPESNVHAREFRVMSEEWSAVPTEPVQLAVVYVGEDNATCTLTPGPTWLAEQFFPSDTKTFTQADLDALCASPESYSPRSIYSDRTLQAMRRVLAIRNPK